MRSSSFAKLLALSFSSSLILLSGCAHVAIQDAEWCVDLGPVGSSCFHTLHKGLERDVDPKTWTSERIGMVCGRAASFGALKAAAIKLCIDSSRCVFVSEDAGEGAK